MAKEKIWIQNAYRSAIEIITRDEKTHTAKKFQFAAVTVDRLTGRTITDGYTAMDKDDFEYLKANSNAFNSCINSSKLIVYDKMPAGAMSSSDRILLLQEENRTLRERVKELEAKYEPKKSEGKKAADKAEQAPADSE
jgi:hypothetical protein